MGTKGPFTFLSIFDLVIWSCPSEGRVAVNKYVKYGEEVPSDP